MHAQLDELATEDNLTEEQADAVFGRAWAAAMRMTVNILRDEQSPANVAVHSPGPEHRSALALLKAEHQDYLQSLNHALTVQLLVLSRAPADGRC